MTSDEQWGKVEVDSDEWWGCVNWLVMSDEAKLNWLVMRDNCLFRPLYQAFSLYLMYIEKAEKAQVQGYGYMPATF